MWIGRDARAQPADDAGREEIHAEDKQQAEPQQPAVRMQQPRQQRQSGVGGRVGGDAHQRLQIVLRQDEDGGADDRAVHRAHAADHHHQQDIQHDRKTQRRIGAGIAQPQRVQRAGAGGNQRREAIGVSQMKHGAVAQRLGAKAVFAHRLQHPAERRVDHAQQAEDHRGACDEDDVIGQRAAVDGEAEPVLRDQDGARAAAIPAVESCGHPRRRSATTIATPAPERRTPPPA